MAKKDRRAKHKSKARPGSKPLDMNKAMRPVLAAITLRATQARKF